MPVDKVAVCSRFSLSRRLAWAACLPLQLSACGSSDAAREATPRALEADEGPHGAMSYKGEKLEIDCPGKFPVPKREQGSPVDDIVGLRLGVPYNVAVRFAQCPDGEEADSILQEGFGTRFHRDERGLQIKTSAAVAVGSFPSKLKGIDYMKADPSDFLEKVDSVWTFVADGMPGREIVYGIWRRQPFAEGSQPTIDSQVKALAAKYGTPTVADENGRTLYWMQTPQGAPIPVFDRDLINRCKYGVSARGQNLSYNGECGRVVTAMVEPAQNLVQARSVSVAVFDPARLWEYQNTRFEAERDAVIAQEAGAAAKDAKGGTF